MDLPTIANFAEAFAVIVAVVFGMVQLRQLNAPRRREAAFALMHSIQSPQMLRGILIIDRLQDAPAKAGIDALPENDQVDVNGAARDLGKPRHPSLPSRDSTTDG